MKRRPRHTGFTLVELMVVLAIGGILAAVALPSYRSYLMRGHRADVRIAMADVAQWLERQYAVSSSFCPDGSQSCSDYQLPGAVSRVPAAGTRVYQLSLSPFGATSYRIVATPDSTGPMARDTCGTLTLDNTGARGQSRGTEADCWRR